MQCYADRCARWPAITCTGKQTTLRDCRNVVCIVLLSAIEAGIRTMAAGEGALKDGSLSVLACNLPVYASQWLSPDITQDLVRSCELGFAAVSISGD